MCSFRLFPPNQKVFPTPLNNELERYRLKVLDIYEEPRRAPPPCPLTCLASHTLAWLARQLLDVILLRLCNFLARKVSQAPFLYQSKAGGGNGPGTRLTDLLRACARRYLQFLFSHAPPHMTFFCWSHDDLWTARTALSESDPWLCQRNCWQPSWKPAYLFCSDCIKSSCPVLEQFWFWYRM